MLLTQVRQPFPERFRTGVDDHTATLATVSIDEAETGQFL
jgi:hypothetical protein